jgi:glycosyltransferase involved in cell wall biosynthesis
MQDTFRAVKILFCNYEYPPLGGGGGVVMAALARELARRHTVTVLTSRALGLPAQSMDGGARVIRAPVFFRKELAVANLPSMLAYLPMATLRGWTLRRSGVFDVINTHFVVPTGPVGHILSRLYGVPNVLSVHGGDLYDPSKASSPHRHAWLRAPIRALLRRADSLVGQSRNTLEHVETIYGVRRETRLIPLGIDRPPTPPRVPRSEFGIPQDSFVMVTVGRVVARKSTLQLVQALRAAERPAAHLLIVGDGPDTEIVRKAALEGGVGERVHFLGQTSEERKYQALCAADIFVSTSQHEGFGLVFLEAMACGLPIICYDHGGQTDFLTDGETGFVVPLNDLDRFTRSIVTLHDQIEVRGAMAHNNRRRVEDYFIDTCANRYEAEFESVVRQYALTRRGTH